MRTEFERQGAPGRVVVDRDHPRRAQHPQELDGEAAQPASTQHYGCRAWDQFRQNASDCMIGGGAGIAQRARIARIEPIQLRSSDEALKHFY